MSGGNTDARESPGGAMVQGEPPHSAPPPTNGDPSAEVTMAAQAAQPSDDNGGGDGGDGAGGEIASLTVPDAEEEEEDEHDDDDEPPDPWKELIRVAARSGTMATLQTTLQRMDPQAVMRMLLNHVKICPNRGTCPTCCKLRKTMLAAKKKRERRKALWLRFRAGGRVTGVLQLANQRAAERVYAPGAVGALSAAEEFATLATRGAGRE